MLIPDIRRIYDRPWHNGGCANPGKIPTCIHVAVRPETTVRTLETVLRAFAQPPATRACLAGVGGIGILDGDTGSFGLVFDKGLKLPPGLMMQPSLHALARFDPAADVRQVFHSQDGKTVRLLSRHLKPDRRRTHHRLSPLVDMLATLDIAADGLGTDIARRVYVVRAQFANPPAIEISGFLAEDL